MMSASVGMDDSFEAYAADDHKFIALVVSSSDDDMDDSVSYSSSISHGERSVEVGSFPVATPSISVSVVEPVVNHQRKVSAASTATRKSQERKNGEKKRWSLISNHSHSSSSKKRWSMLSSFTLDSNTKENQTQRVSSTSAASQHSGKATHDVSLENITNTNNNNSNNSRSSSMKRSSTGTSLRQLFNKISISDKEVGGANKENIPVTRVVQPKQNTKSIIIPSPKARTSSTSSSSSAFRAPLRPVNGQTTSHHPPHNTQLRNRSSMQLTSHRNSFQAPSIYSQATTATNTTATSASGNSLSGKWKFWKKSGSPSSSELPKSVSTQSLNVNMMPPHSTDNFNHRRKASIASSMGPNSPTSSTSTVRNRTSFTDFHKSLFSSDVSGSNINSTTGGERRLSINNKRSSSSLSISLKHKTSYTSLKKFKSRRKSNTTADDGSSFVSAGSGSNNNSNMNRTNSNNIISLPIPDEVSREKIRAKLRNSTSLLSLNSTTPISRKDFDENILNQVLNITSVKYVLTDIDLKQTNNSDLEVLSSHTSLKLTDNVWRMISTRDTSQTVICKKLPLDSNSKALSLNELQILKLVSGTPGLPVLTQSYVHKSSSSSNDHRLSLYLFFKDQGSSLEHTTIHSWSQCLNIFWQCVNILYVTETKFKFEHRNLTLDHILVDNNGNVTLCDMDTCRAQASPNPDSQVFYKRLDHPIFYQNKKEFAFDIYQSMRQYFNGEPTWSNFEPRTNLLWLHYLAIMLLKQNTNGKFMGPGRDQLHRIAALLEYNTVSTSRRNSIFKRKENEIKSTGDLMKFK